MECTPSDHMAELPVTAAATNLVTAMARLPASAAYTTFFEPVATAFALQSSYPCHNRCIDSRPHGFPSTSHSRNGGFMKVLWLTVALLFAAASHLALAQDKKESKKQ